MTTMLLTAAGFTPAWLTTPPPALLTQFYETGDDD